MNPGTTQSVRRAAVVAQDSVAHRAEPMLSELVLARLEVVAVEPAGLAEQTASAAKR